MRIGLNLIQKDQGVGLLVHLVACDSAQLEIEFLNGIGIHENFCAVLVVGEIHLDVVGKQALPNFANDEGLANLSRTIDDKQFVGIVRYSLVSSFSACYDVFTRQRYAFPRKIA